MDTPDARDTAVRQLGNVKEEVPEQDAPDKGRIARWLGKPKSALSSLFLAGTVLEKAKEVFESFSFSL